MRTRKVNLSGVFALFSLLFLFACRSAPVADIELQEESPLLPNEEVISTPQPAKSCGDGVCDGPENHESCPDDCPIGDKRPTLTPKPTRAQPSSSAEPKFESDVLYIGIMVHLEGWQDGIEEGNFERHIAWVRTYADLFEKYDAKLTLESKEVTDGVIKWGDNVLAEMEQRGHGIGVHADVGGERNYDCSKFADELAFLKLKLETLGVTVRHVSGVTSHCDWVTSAIDAGFSFTTGTVAYSTLSLSEALQPEEYKDCHSPSMCHDVYPPELIKRLQPWRVNSGADWIIHDPEGELVILPSSGGLSHMMTEAGYATGEDEDEGFTQADIEASIQELEAAIALVDSGVVNTYYWSWSLGGPLDIELLEQWLQAIDPYVQSGQVEWVTLPEMVDLYREWEENQH